MTDKENVITHLQIIHTWAEFARERNLQFFTAKHLEDIADWSADAITLLKEQKPIKPLKHNDDYSQYWQCGHCFEPLITVSNYCHKCGRKVQWDD